MHKRQNDISNKKENMTSKTGSINEIQVSDSDSSAGIEDNDSIGWRSLPEIATTLEDIGTCNIDEMEWLDNSFYEQDHMISNLDYVKLKMSNFAVKLLNSKLIMALFDAEATCSCISHHLYINIYKIKYI